MADFDGDGRAELLSGGAPRAVRVFRGLGSGTFGTAETLTSLAELSNEGDTAVAVADWDRDGVLDLLVGTQGGRVFNVRNRGTVKRPEFGGLRPLAIQAAGHDLCVEGYAAPAVADWDGDGDLDLIVGDRAGHVLLYRNSPVQGRPTFGDGTELVPSGEGFDEGPQYDLRPAIGDWNGDGKLDLLVGDEWDQKLPKPVLNAEQEKELDSKREELRRLGSRLGGERQRVGDEVCQKMGLDWHDLWKLDAATRTRYGEAVELALKSGRAAEIQAEIDRVAKRVEELDPPGIRRHGRVWVYLREPR